MRCDHENLRRRLEISTRKKEGRLRGFLDLYRLPLCVQARASSTLSLILPSSPSHVKFFTLFVLICCFRSLFEWSFCLSRLITHISYFTKSYLFCFNLVGRYDVVLCCYEKRFSFSLKISLSLTCTNLFM